MLGREAPESEQFAAQLAVGAPTLVAWLRKRCQRVASGEFSPWAWRWIREDFCADLLYQLSRASRGPDFVLRGAVEPYVDTAIRNLCRRYFRDLARIRRHVPIDTADGLPSQATDTLARVAACHDVRRALELLSPECRRLIREKYLDERSSAEIGLAIGVPEKTVRSRLHTCRERLRGIWESTRAA